MFNLTKIYVTLFYTGYFKFAPGTIGSLISINIIFALYYFLNQKLFFILFILFFLFSLYFIEKYIKKIKKKDPSEIIIDEFLGIYIIFFVIDYTTNMSNFMFVFIGFILFRFFDILKPFPIKLIDKKIKNSFGIIFDDLLAGIYTATCLLIINELI